MKIIRFQRPKPDMRDVKKCDSCGGGVNFHSTNHAFYLCSGCKNTVDARLKNGGIDTKGFWKTVNPIVQTVPKVFKPYRPRKTRKCVHTAFACSIAAPK